jgi:hypothetical protein
MDPSPLVFAVDLDPDVVFTVPDPPYARTHGPAKHGEAVGELTSTATSSLEQGPDVAVAREPFICPTLTILTPV